MTPTIVLKNGRPVLVTGSPGASRIITAVLQVIVNTVDLKLALDDAVKAPRIHHQWWPDEISAEQGLTPETMRSLQERGHKLVQARPSGSANSIMVTPQGIVGAADPRTRGALAVGY
jgi:gamma-glutamyltranspeptidase/glutathione hydrolase